MTMIREATKVNGVVTTIVGNTIPSSGVYTVSFEDTFITKEQKITGSTNYGGFIQTVNINTQDENNILHKGLAFVAVPTEQ